MSYRYSKSGLARDLAKSAMMDGFCHQSRFFRRHPALSEDEMPGRFLKRYMQYNPETIDRIKELKAKDFSVRY